MKVFGREVSFWIGLIVSLVLAVVQVLSGNGLISTDSVDAITNVTNSASQLALILAPLVATLIVRQAVTPVSQPKLEVGTPVLVDRPAGQPEDTPPPDAVVALKSDLKTTTETWGNESVGLPPPQ